MKPCRTDEHDDEGAHEEVHDDSLGVAEAKHTPRLARSQWDIRLVLDISFFASFPAGPETNQRWIDAIP